MKRFLLVTMLGATLAGGCNKPEAEDCRKAILNMEKLLGTSNMKEATDIEGEVRRCKGGSSKESVACAIRATTLEDIKACGFLGAKAKK